MKNYTVLDIETTGLSRYKHCITEIAAVKFENGFETENVYDEMVEELSIVAK